MSEPAANDDRPTPRNWGRSIIRTAGLALIRTFYRVRTVNPERVPRTGGVLLLPNHVTFADAFYISAACSRPVRFVMDEGFMSRNAVAWFCTIFNTVTIRKDQPREALRITIDALRAGDVVCFFPEGQLSRTGTLNELKRGVELIAKKADAPLVPMWIDGAWGSIFSFERGRFFRKRPYRIPHPLTVAFGPPLTSAEATLDTIRRGMLKAAARAIQARLKDETRSSWINGYQIGQVSALGWRKSFGALEHDPLVKALPSLFEAFATHFGAHPVLRPHPKSFPKAWIGGNLLREELQSGHFSGHIDFYDFSDRANEPLSHPGIRHFPCLAVEGRVISMSLPDPHQPHSGSIRQHGSKPGSWGRLLPGWFTKPDPSGRVRVKGPAAPQGILLPPGVELDAEGFVLAPALAESLPRD